MGALCVSSGPDSYTPNMNERRRFEINVVMITRRDFRKYFGLSFANKWGHFIDQYIIPKINSFGNWAEMTDGDIVLKESLKIKQRNWILAAIVSKDGYYLFSYNEACTVSVWDLIKGTLIRRFTAHPESITCLAHHHSGWFVTGSKDGSIRLCDAKDPYYKMIYEMKASHFPVNSVNFNQRGTQLVSGGKDTIIRVWSVHTGECLKTFDGHSDVVASVQFVGNRFILSGSLDKSIKVWDCNDTRTVRSIQPSSQREIRDIVRNRDGSLIACLFHSGVRVFDWPDLNVVCTVNDHIRCGAFHPLISDMIAISIVSDDVVKMFDIRTGECIRTLPKFDTMITSVNFTPSGKHIIVACLNGSIHFSDVSDL